MLTYQDEKRVRQIIREETQDIRKTTSSTAVNVDKILEIVTADRQELAVTKSRVTQHHKRLVKIERKLKLPVSSASALS